MSSYDFETEFAGFTLTIVVLCEGYAQSWDDPGEGPEFEIESVLDEGPGGLVESSVAAVLEAEGLTLAELEDALLPVVEDHVGGRYEDDAERELEYEAECLARDCYC